MLLRLDRLGRKRNVQTKTRKVNVHRGCRVKVDFTMAGYHWIMHNHDEDINSPSCPHCHATDSPKVYKLDVYTGKYFEYPGEKYKGKISRQEMKKMWKQKDFLENVLRERQWYEDTYRKINPERYPPLPPLPIVLKHSKLSVRVTKRWIRNNIRKLNSCTHSMQ